jgi:hypothetical protein
MDPEALLARITRLEDIEAIKQLKARYCDICDDDHNAQRIPEVFAANAIWEGRGIGRAEGHEEIQDLFRRFHEAISFSQHMAVNPVIDVDGGTASGTWYFFGPFTMREDNRAVWQAARYHEQYVKENGEWKILRLTVRGPRMSADYHKGWAK